MMQTDVSAGAFRGTLFFWCCLLALFAILLHLRLPFALFEYPWLFPDSFDWLWNAFVYSRESPLPISHRGMFFTLLGSLAFRLGFQDFLPLFGTLAYFFAVVVQYFGARRVFGHPIALLSSLILATSANFMEQSAYLGCDVAACVWLSAAFYFYIAFLRDRSFADLTIAALSFVCGFHTQYIGAIVFPVFALAWFISFDPDSPIFTTKRLRLIRTNPRPICFIALASLSLFFAFLLPRWLRYQVLYEEKVQHVSLLRPVWNVPFYLSGLLATLSWPVVLFGLLGLWALYSDKDRSRPTLVLAGWSLAVFGFFSLLYAWRDTRFLIYLFSPFMIFAAAGAIYVAGRFRFQRTATIALGVLLMAAGHVRSSGSVFENSFYVTPTQSFIMTPAGGFESLDSPLKVSLIATKEFATKYHRTLDDTDVDGTLLSEPAQRLLAKIGRSRSLKRTKVVLLEQIHFGYRYFMQNRNQLYAGREVKLVMSWRGVLSELAEKPIVLVIRSHDAEHARAFIGLPRLFTKYLASEGDWHAGIFQLPPGWMDSIAEAPGGR